MSSQNEPVLSRREEAVLVLTLNNPQKRNAISLSMRAALRDHLNRAESDVRAIVLTGAEGYFSTGGDFSDTREPEAERERFQHFTAIIDTMVTGSRPVIAAVEGGAHGAGLGLVAASDYVLCGESTVLATPFVKLGLTADAGLSWSLPQRIGVARARRMVLNGESLDATTAHAWGLVDEIVGDGEAERRALEVAKLWSSRAPLAVGVLKRVFARGQLSHRDALAQEGLDQRTLMGTRDTAEALVAFLEKRRPVFEGR